MARFDRAGIGGLSDEAITRDHLVMMRLVGYVEEASTGELRGVWLNLETGERGVSRDLDNTIWAPVEPEERPAA